jgi:hypothetical protein
MRGDGPWEASAPTTTSQVTTQAIVKVPVSTTTIYVVTTHLMIAIPDHDTRSEGFYILDYPGPAGQPIRDAKTTFARTRQANDQAGQAPWAPFADKDEWEFGLWMLRTLGRQQMDDLLQLNFVRTPPRLLSGISV